jgi:hypothetical protein
VLINTPLQVLRAAPALQSVIIDNRVDVAHILKYVFGNCRYLRKLFLKGCYLAEVDGGLLQKIVVLYPNLEVLSLQSCSPLTSAEYSLIPHLKKLSELELWFCEVDYIYVKPLKTHVCIHEHM